MFDETTDNMGRYILNILIGECSSQIRKKAILIRTVELDKTNSENINIEILDLINSLYNSNPRKFINVKLLLSDRASYALKVGTMLKSFIPDLKHVTCICHALHNLCETICDQNNLVNKLISNMKRVLIKIVPIKHYLSKSRTSLSQAFL